ncbi:cupin-like domain-containing protein [Actinomadura barringtoniae]|uniref:Cupin-like domain-containing protein n=1 Tax=Actinomadura barringtoniae TaxID=1427535 RepID=A0A939T6X0_9ACTN|nr:cupin domain-containing protein [Actinomadura barringtoniae]MBO2455436.1 cupin-like domain-containing protein [Actinomadura barringtoniae]
MIDLIVEVLGGEEFLARDLGRAHRVFTASAEDRDRFCGLLTWPALNEILNTHRLDPPRLRLAQGGDTIPTSQYCERRTYRRMPPWDAPQPHLVAAQLQDGATLVLDAIEETHPPIRELVSGLERQLHTGVQVNAYASWTAQEGFGVHWDDHDVIVIQISGAKRWRIYGPTRPAPLYRDVVFEDTPPEQPIDEFTLQAGDVLHVPRGWWHAAAASTGQPSLHLTCGLTTHTGIDLLSWLVDELRAHEVIRADLPRLADEASQTAWCREAAKLLAERLEDPALISSYLAARDAAYGSHGGFSLPLAANEHLPADAGLQVWMTTPRAVTRDNGETVALEVAGQRWVLARQAAPLLRLLTSGRPSSLGALAQAADIPIDQAAALLDELLRAGVVAVREP